MHCFLRYNKKSGTITGFFRTSTNEYVPEPLSPDEANIEVTDAEQVELLSTLNPRTNRLRGTVDAGKLRTLKTEPIFKGRIELSCDLPDRDGDGLPELPADGKSVTRVKATLRGSGDNVLAEESTAIRFQVSRGLLSRRHVNSEKGIAEVELRSVPETVRIQVVATAEGFERATLELEIIPPDEYRFLSEAR